MERSKATICLRPASDVVFLTESEEDHTASPACPPPVPLGSAASGASMTSNRMPSGRPELFAANFAGHCLPMGSNGIGECQCGSTKTTGPHGPRRLFSPLLYQLSYLAQRNGLGL